MDRCSECGFDYDGEPVSAVPGDVRRYAAGYRQRLVNLTDPDMDGRLRHHSGNGVWSALEYACHVRDVLAVQTERLQLALRVEAPMLEPMGREERVEREHYNAQAPAAVAAAIEQHAESFAIACEALRPEDWQRVAYRPDGVKIDVRWLGRNTVHELLHHRNDIDAQVAAATGH